MEDWICFQIWQVCRLAWDMPLQWEMKSITPETVELLFLEFPSVYISIWLASQISSFLNSFLFGMYCLSVVRIQIKITSHNPCYSKLLCVFIQKTKQALASLNNSRMLFMLFASQIEGYSSEFWIYHVIDKSDNSLCKALYEHPFQVLALRALIFLFEISVLSFWLA